LNLCFSRDLNCRLCLKKRSVCKTRRIVHAYNDARLRKKTDEAARLRPPRARWDNASMHAGILSAAEFLISHCFSWLLVLYLFECFLS
jgi:hypothetical protein